MALKESINIYSNYVPVSQIFKSIGFTTDLNGDISIDFSLLESFPIVYEINIQMFDKNTDNGINYYGRAYILYQGPGTSFLYMIDGFSTSNLSLSQLSPNVLSINSNKADHYMVISFNAIEMNNSQIEIVTSETSPYLLATTDITVYNTSFTTATASDGYAAMYIALAGTGMAYKCSYAVTVSTTVEQASSFVKTVMATAIVNIDEIDIYGNGTIASSTYLAFTKNNDNNMNINIASHPSDPAALGIWIGDSTLFVSPDYAPMYVTLNRITNSYQNSIPATGLSPYTYNSSFTNSTIFNGYRFTTDSSGRIFIKMGSTAQNGMYATTQGDFFVYKFICAQGSNESNNIFGVFYVYISGWTITVNTSQANNVTASVNTSSYVLTIDTTLGANKKVFISFERIITASTAIKAPVRI